MYFVLDRSNSMNTGDRWQIARTALGEVMRSLDGSVRAGVSIFPGRDVKACGPGMELIAPMSAANGAASEAFLRTSSEHFPGGGTPTAITLRDLFPKLKALRAEQSVHVVLATDGGPNCGATVTSCEAADCTLNIEGTREECPVVGGRNCCADNPGACLDQDDTESVLREYADAGIAVYVVGVTESPRLRRVLDGMARAAGTAQNGQTAYFTQGEGLDNLRATLGGVMRDIATSCSIPLQQVTMPERMRVELGGQHARANDPGDGFTLSGNRLTLHGAACALRKGGAALRIRWLDECR